MTIKNGPASSSGVGRRVLILVAVLIAGVALFAGAMWAIVPTVIVLMVPVAVVMLTITVLLVRYGGAETDRVIERWFDRLKTSALFVALRKV